MTAWILYNERSKYRANSLVKMAEIGCTLWGSLVSKCCVEELSGCVATKSLVRGIN